MNDMKVRNSDDIYVVKGLGHGKCADCYLTKDNKVLKVFYNPNYFEDRVKKVYKLNVPKLVFPDEIVKLNDDFIGYLMEPIDGTLIDKVSSIDIETFIREVRLLEYSIAELAIKKYFLFDCRSENIMYTKDGHLVIIDTDFYVEEKNNKELYSNNLSYFSPQLLGPILNIDETEFKSKKLNHLKNLLLEGKYLPSKFLVDLLKELRSKTINTTEELKNKVKLVKNGVDTSVFYKDNNVIKRDILKELGTYNTHDTRN